MAKYPGNVAACKKVDPEVEHTMYQNIEDWNEKEKKMQRDYVEGHPYGPEAAEDDLVEVSNNNAAPSNKGKKRPAATPSVGKYFKPRTGPGDQPTIKSILQGEAVKERTDMCVTRWFLDASIPFHAPNSEFYQPMFDVVAAFGGGYKARLCNSYVVDILQKLLKRLGSLLMDSIKIGGKVAALLWLMDGLTEREGPSSISWSTVSKVLSFLSQLMPLVAPRREIFCSNWSKM